MVKHVILWKLKDEVSDKEKVKRCNKLADQNRKIAAKIEKKHPEYKNDFAKLSEDVRSLYGSQAAYYLAEIQYKKDNLKEAEATLNNFIDAGTPHQYWLARGFILLADVYHKQGNSFEACEYLESLKSNYPGKEADIFSMIEERLAKWKTK